MQQHGMLVPHASVIVAVSGGPDSVTLLHVLTRLSEAYHLKLHVFHMDHGLRGESSRADAHFVQQLADKYGLPCTVVTIPPGQLEAQVGSLEANARTARYQAIEKLSRTLGATHVAVGQQQDDQAETVIMHFVRGSGIRGLAGISPVRSQGGLIFLRPLLATSRSAIEAYCAAHELNARIDESNLSRNYQRNRVRLTLIPHLRDAYNPAITETLGDMTVVLRAEEELLGEISTLAFQRCRAPGPDVALVGRQMLQEPIAIARRLVRMAVEKAIGHISDIGLPLVSQVLTLAGRPDGTHQIQLPGGILVLVEYGILRFLPTPHEMPSNLPQVLVVPGVTEFPSLGIRLTVQPGASQTQGAILLNADILPGPLAVRQRQPGDRICPVGMAGSKKLQDILVDAKVPKRLRNQVPVLVAGDEIVWVIGHRVDRRFLAQEGAQNLLEIRCDSLG
jgi:tRNA(Ile)-lysidine synthase